MSRVPRRAVRSEVVAVDSLDSHVLPAARYEQSHSEVGAGPPRSTFGMLSALKCRALRLSGFGFGSVLSSNASGNRHACCWPTPWVLGPLHRCLRRLMLLTSRAIGPQAGTGETQNPCWRSRHSNQPGTRAPHSRLARCGTDAETLAVTLPFVNLVKTWCDSLS